MKENVRTSMITISFIVFLLIVIGSSIYLIGIVPAPNTQIVDCYSAVHAFAAAGFAFFILISTPNNATLRKYAFFSLLALIFIWEIIENTALRKTALSGYESLGNIGMDILIGTLSMGIVFSTQNKTLYSKSKNKKNPRTNLS